MVQELRRQAQALLPQVRAPWVRAFLRASAELPPIADRAIYSEGAGAARRFYGAPEAARLPPARRARLQRRSVDEERYYYGRYGTPLSYARPLDLLAAAGLDGVAGRRVLDFGYGQIGAPRLLASLGADVTGVDVDEEMFAAYGAAGDQGEIGHRGGRLRLLLGRFPQDAAVRDAVGQGYDLVLAKNVLKRGYVHPERPAPERRLIRLGTDDETFVRALAGLLRPGGRILLYNLCPAPAPPDRPYIPWADGRNPFPAALWEAAGLRVVAFDRDDTPAARALGHALGWDRPDPRSPGEPPMDLTRDLFATYSLLEKPGR